MHRDIAFLIYPGFQLLDLAGPIAAFQMAGYDAHPEPYRIRVVSEGGGAVRSSVGVAVLSEPFGDARADALPADTLIVVGGEGRARARSPP